MFAAVNVTDCSVSQFKDVNVKLDGEMLKRSDLLELKFKVTSVVGLDASLNVHCAELPSTNVIGVLSKIIPTSTSVSLQT